jgi:hypothetical protein
VIIDMDLDNKINYIGNTHYRYENKTYNSEETLDYFDLDLARSLFENVNSFINCQDTLLTYFDFSKIFNNPDNMELQRYLYDFMILKQTDGIDILLELMPLEKRIELVNNAFNDIHEKHPVYFGSIISTLKNDEEKVLFFNTKIDLLSDDEIVNMIKSIYDSNNPESLKTIMQNERVMDIAVKTINPPFFYEMVEKLNLGEEFITKRIDMLKEIISNYDEYNPKDVKEAYIELLCRNTLNNSSLDLFAIKEYADNDENVKQELMETYDIISKLVEFMDNPRELTEKDINLLSSEIPINHEYISKLFLLCQKHFENDIEEESSKDVYDGLSPRIITSSNGKEVEIYDLENQGPSQRELPMLVSTVPLYRNDAKGFIEAYYSQENGDVKYGRRSCSLIDETKLDCLFCGQDRITFGFTDLSDRKLIASNITDGGTDGNDFRFGKERRVRRNVLLPVKKFVEKTKHHTEILLASEEKGIPMKPAFILVSGKEPTQLEIDIAAEFGIPIRKVNKEKYEQVPDNKMGYPYKEYDYYSFSRTPISKVNEKDMNM